MVGVDECGCDVNHFLVVDMNIVAVLDSRERSALRLQEGVPEKCMGDSIKSWDVYQTRQLGEQDVGRARRPMRRNRKKRNRDLM